MHAILFLIACYTLQWTVRTLQGEVELGAAQSLSLFGIGIIATPILAWSGIHLLTT